MGAHTHTHIYSGFIISVPHIQQEIKHCNKKQNSNKNKQKDDIIQGQ